ncbi:hypothetical protein LguiA_035852 [Lonicera macranthoides]
MVAHATVRKVGRESDSIRLGGTLSIPPVQVSILRKSAAKREDRRPSKIPFYYWPGDHSSTRESTNQITCKPITKLILVKGSKERNRGNRKYKARGNSRVLSI